MSAPRTSPRPAGPGQRPEPLGASDQAQLARAFAALLPRCDAIADTITDRLIDLEGSVYAHLPERAAELRSSTRAHIRITVERMAGSPRADRRGVDLWRETGRRRAAQEVPMAAVLSSYSIGTRVLWEELVRVGEELDVPAAVLLHAGQVLWSGLDVQSQVLRDSYRREESLRDRYDPARVAEVLDGLLRGRGADPDFGAEARSALGLTTDAELLCVVWLTEETSPVTTTLREQLQDAGLISHWRPHAGHVVGLVQGTPEEAVRVREVLARTTRGRVGTAASPDGLAGILAAHRSAMAAATSFARGSDGVADITQRLPEALLAASPELTTLLVDATIRPLLHVTGVTREVLLETLVAAVRHGGSATRAAEDLVCHRNTVIYRVKRIEELTGLSLDQPRDRLLLSLAALAVRENLGPPDSPT